MDEPTLFLEEDSIDLIFDWIFNEFVQPDGTVNFPESKVLKNIFEKIVGEHGHVFKETYTPTRKEEAGHFLYYYGDAGTFKRPSVQGTVKPYLEKSSHQWIATALCVFATCVKYQEKLAETTYSKSLVINEYIQVHSLEEQAMKCNQFFPSVPENSDVCGFNPHGIFWQHWGAYHSVFRGICESCFDDEEVLVQLIFDGNMPPRGSGYQACLWFLKGFITSLKLTSGKNPSTTLCCYQTAMKLEPLHYFWSWITYLTGRGEGSVDSQNLLECAKTAYEFSPPNLKSRTGLSLILGQLEIPRLIGETYWTEATCRLLENVRYNLQRDFSTLHTKWAALKLGELYIGSSGMTMMSDRELKGKKLLDECYSLFPDCFLTLSALAALYEKGSSSGKYINLYSSRFLMRKVLEDNNEAPLLPTFRFRTPDNISTKSKAVIKTSNKENEKVGTVLSRESALGFECPPLWISNWIPKIPSYTVKKYGSPLAYLKTRSRLLKTDDSLDLDQKELSEETLSTTSNEAGSIMHGEKWVCDRICGAALAQYVENATLFNKIMTQCELALNKGRVQGQKRHLKVYSYLIMATCVYDEVLGLKKGNGSYQNMQTLQDKLTQVKQNWLLVKNSPVIHFVKGRLAELMGIARDISLDQYRKAVKLEPETLLWHQMLYEILKQARASGSNFNVPDAEEIQACEKVHELRPQNVKCMIDLATIKLQALSGKLRKSPSGYNAWKETEVLEKLLGDALERSVKGSNEETLAMLKTAEMYTMKGLPERTLEAKRIFLELYKRGSKNSMVLHKVGKFYQFTCSDYAMARKVYEEAMAAAPANYPCLMDLIKLLGRFLKKYKDMVVLIDKHLPYIRDPEHILNLLIIKGQASWLITEKRVACSTWLEGFLCFEHLAYKIKEALVDSNSNPVFGKINISLVEIGPHFKKACENEKVSGNKSVSEFIAFLEKLRQRETTLGTGSRPPTSNAQTRSNVLRGNPRRGTTIFDLVSKQLNRR